MSGSWEMPGMEMFRNKKETDLPPPIKVTWVSDEVELDEFAEAEFDKRQGWFLMPRGWMERDCFRPEPFTEREAYIWSMEKAAFKDHGQWFNESRYPVKRGEFVTSHARLMEAWGWSEKRVRSFVNRMVKLGQWAKRPAHKGAKAPTVLIVCDYEKYQRPLRKAEFAKRSRKE